jgi:hypothetical protein
MSTCLSFQTGLDIAGPPRVKKGSDELGVGGSKVITSFPWFLSGGVWDSSQRPRCSRIFVMTSGWSMKLMMRIPPWDLGQVRWSVS